MVCHQQQGRMLENKKKTHRKKNLREKENLLAARDSLHRANAQKMCTHERYGERVGYTKCFDI
jgi:hypothetical protein